MNIEQAEEVFGIFREHWPQGSVMRVFARNRFGNTLGETIHDPQHLLSWANYWTKKHYSIYVQMNPTRRKGAGRTKGEDITHWCWFLVDLDPISDSPKLDLAREFVESFMADYMGVMHLRYHLIDSGRGWQMWFPIEIRELMWQNQYGTDIIIPLHTQSLARNFELTDISEINTITLPLREAAPRAMSYWLNFLKDRMELVLGDCGVTIDTSVSDLPRVMRMPYTVNIKTGRETTVLRRATGWNPGLGHKLIRYAPYNVWSAPENYDYEMAPGSSFHKYLTHPGMKVAARKYITEGETEGGRHKAATAALLTLKELGCDASQVEAALLWGARLCTPPLEPREITPMIDRHFNRRKT